MSQDGGQLPNPKVNSRTISYSALVRKAWGDQWLVKETVYEFSNGRKMESTDYGTTGIYRGTST